MLHSDNQKPGERFGRYFRISPALDDAAREEVYFVRHDVYARELGYEPVRADQRETDGHDCHALHWMVRTADASSRPVGCARLVLPHPADANLPLPFEIACRDSLDRSIVDPAALPRERIAEVSRLAVMGEFRRRHGESQQAVALSEGDTGGGPASRFPNIPASLYFAAAAMAQRHGIEYLFTLTEPRFAKHLAKIGVKIQPIGTPVEHRGLRVPSMIKVSEIYPGLRALMRPIWHEVHAQIETSYLVQNAMSHALEEEAPLSVWPADA